ncbi:DUF2637 domain-containing protein [Actinacidiphila glaucinigra]|uniref:DUF2637 domain-containing protein n=1 Tax=Actinacidiphila glaucinigra TaxID=235986 RepID=UPI002DD7C83F|nr:DUF2637 domain-containing protein [Actinacidiphila glaucinigra]WSD59486.1 DUF2637 domain-containing protein [Actinacidiphila glaucinigra]
MRLTDTTLDWALPCAVGLAVLAAAAVFLRNRKARKEDAGQADSWERAEERRRKKEALYGTASYVLLFGCASVAAALSFHGLVGFGRQNLGLSGGWEYLVPFGLDGAAMFCSVLAVREASHGDAALGSRMLVWLFAGAAAWFNWVHAPRGGGHAGAPEFFAGMSLSAAVLFDRALKQTRRAALREQGLIPRPLPQIRMVRWLRAPRETYGAWSLMLLEGVRTLDEAVEEVREERARQEQEAMRRRGHERLERARIKAINRQHRIWNRGGSKYELSSPAAAGAQSGAEPAIEPEKAELPARSRPALSPVREETARTTIDLTAEDDTMALPKLDSLERKLADLERQYG